MKTELEFWAQVEIGKQNECWPWKLCRNKKGYGIVQWLGKITRAHRVAFSIHNSKPLSKAHICHHCDNPICCNPAHLFEGNILLNNQDMWSKGRGKIPAGRKFKSKSIPSSLLSKIGKIPDYILAEQCGVEKSTIARRRQKLGIAPFAETSGHDGRFKSGNYPARWLKGVSQ